VSRDEYGPDSTENIGSFFQNTPVRFDPTALRSARPRQKESGGLRRGSRVRHATFGDGVVLQTEGSGSEAKLTVFFDRAGKKKFVAKYANLEKI
jgi:DNA helicase-2/ATP-dependent DNA helicase PcrA